MTNNENQLTWSRRKFFRASSLVLGAAILPSSLLYSKAATLGSSISMLLSYRGKTIGVKFTIVNNSYVVGTIRVPKGKKLALVFIKGPTGKEKSSSRTRKTVKMQGGISGSVTADSRKNTFTTSVKGVAIGRMKFENSKNDDIPSGEGFIQWLGDKIADAARVVAGGLTYLLGGNGIWYLSGGGTLDISGGNIEYNSNSGSFMSEAGLEESPGVWY